MHKYSNYSWLNFFCRCLGILDNGHLFIPPYKKWYMLVPRQVTMKNM